MVVSLDYTLRLDDGQVIDSSNGREALQFLQGRGQIILGLEQALYGMGLGEEKDVEVAPEDGYGETDADAYQDINLSLQYPKLGANFALYDILFSKEEQKYRFNQFWDITKDRDEFPIGSDYPPTGPLIPGTTILQGNYASENTWITGPDGYSRILNPNNMDYNKPELQRKKFRHYLNFLNLKRKQCNDINMIVKMTNTKTQFSPR